MALANKVPTDKVLLDIAKAAKRGEIKNSYYEVKFDAPEQGIQAVVEFNLLLRNSDRDNWIHINEIRDDKNSIVITEEAKMALEARGIKFKVVATQDDNSARDHYIEGINHGRGWGNSSKAPVDMAYINEANSKQDPTW